MKLFFSLLVALPLIQGAFAQMQPSTPTTTVLRVNGNGVQWMPGSQGQSSSGSWAQQAEELRRRNDRNSGDLMGRPAAPCTRVQPGSSNMVQNPCRDSGSAWEVALPSCNVNYTGISEITYGPENLKGLILKGQHNAPSGSGFKLFEIMDLDGFLSLASLHSSWQNNLLVQINASGPVNLPIADVRSAQAIVAMGIRYHEVVEARVRQQNDASLAWYLEKIIEKKNFLRTLGSELASWNSAGGRVSAGRIRAALSQGLERFAPTTNEDERLLSQYRDLSIDDRPYILCNPDSGSEMIGQVVCSRNFVDSSKRNANFCPGGISFNSLSSLPVCELQEGENGLCRASLYSASSPVAPGGYSPAAGSGGAGAR